MIHNVINLIEWKFSYSESLHYAINIIKLYLFLVCCSVAVVPLASCGATGSGSPSSSGHDDVILLVGGNSHDSGKAGTFQSHAHQDTASEDVSEIFSNDRQSEVGSFQTTEKISTTRTLTPKPPAEVDTDSNVAESQNFAEQMNFDYNFKEEDYDSNFQDRDRFTRAVLHSNSKRGSLVGGGKAGQDFPNLSKIPRTDFSCQGRIPGYYADESTACQVRLPTKDKVVIINLS